jgi:tetratricopeptide (TPR) repeat protein
MKIRCEKLFPGRIFNARIAEVDGLDWSFSAQVVEMDQDGVAVQLQPSGDFEIVEATPEERDTLLGAGYEVNDLLSPKQALGDADYERGCALLAENKCDEAIMAFTQALAHNPADVQAYYNRGYARTIKLLSMGSLTIASETNRNIFLEAGSVELIELAIRDFTLAISYNPGMLKAYGMRAEMYWKRGQSDLARADLTLAARQGDENAVRLLRERFGESH